MHTSELTVDGLTVPVYRVHTAVVGSGAASLRCAEALHSYGLRDVCIITDRLGGGTSANAGSDKQTYYKLSVFGKTPDSPHDMARTLFDGGAMHGDLALIESAMSLEAFYRLVSLGVGFPHNHLGGFVGYKTDHDPRQRATSAGPLTSQQMVECLLQEVKRRRITVFDGHDAVALVTDASRIYGVLTIDKNRLSGNDHGLALFRAECVVFGVGGPGGLYANSAYPAGHAGAIGLALEAGARAANLPESQHGISSIKFRWNVSGTYQQVLPRYVSTDRDGNGEREFLTEYFDSPGACASAVFLKGYQWPFDPRKLTEGGSSLIDMLVHIETVVKKRRVFLDFRSNPATGRDPFPFDQLTAEARDYLGKSQALFGTPIERLAAMNPPAIELFRKNGIDLYREPLEIAVCAQHNNGGLLGDLWWESNIRRLFPIGEVNGTQGVYRPGGAALNAGQVGALRAAQRIVNVYGRRAGSGEAFARCARAALTRMTRVIDGLSGPGSAAIEVAAYHREIQCRMSDCAAHIREATKVEDAVIQALVHVASFDKVRVSSPSEIPAALTCRHLSLAHAAYLQALRFYIENGGGSRGSYLVVDEKGLPINDKLGREWRFVPENESLRDRILETVMHSDGTCEHRFVPRRPIPEEESWFENVWGAYLRKEVFRGS